MPREKVQMRKEKLLKTSLEKCQPLEVRKKKMNEKDRKYLAEG